MASRKQTPMAETVEVIEALARKNERLRSALTGLLDVLGLSVPPVFPDLQTWATKHKEDKHHINGREARAILEGFAALNADTKQEIAE